MKPAAILVLLTLPLAAAVSNPPGSVRVRVHTGAGLKLVELPLEQYVAAVLAGEILQGR